MRRYTKTTRTKTIMYTYVRTYIYAYVCIITKPNHAKPTTTMRYKNEVKWTKCERFEREQRIIQQFHLVDTCGFFFSRWLASFVWLYSAVMCFGYNYVYVMVCMYVCVCIFIILYILYFSHCTHSAQRSSCLCHYSVTAFFFDAVYFISFHFFFFSVEVYSTLTIFLVGYFLWIIYVEVTVFGIRLFLLVCICFRSAYNKTSPSLSFTPLQLISFFFFCFFFNCFSSVVQKKMYSTHK